MLIVLMKMFKKLHYSQYEEKFIKKRQFSEPVTYVKYSVINYTLIAISDINLILTNLLLNIIWTLLKEIKL